MIEQLQNKTIHLAPLAGYTDRSFRLICYDLGVDSCYTEMVNVKGLYYNDEKTKRLTIIDDKEKNTNIQIFGNDPKMFEYVIKNNLNYRNDFNEININIGCPVNKIIKNKEGSFLLNDLLLLEKILDISVKSSIKPISLKYRMGFLNRELNYLDVAKIAENVGISKLILHARTREQMYTGYADWDHIYNLKKNVSIPVIANGDIFSVENFIDCIKKTNADGVMIARGSLGNPFIFKQIKDYIYTGKYKVITNKMKIEMLICHYNKKISFDSEKVTITQMRKHLSFYLKSIYGSNVLKNKLNKINNILEIINILMEFKDQMEE